MARHRLTREDSSRGGKAVLRKYGRNYMVEIGKRGFKITADKFGGKDILITFIQRRSREVGDPAPWNNAWTRPREDR